jgi:uncharacterized phage-associated protein
LLTGYRGHSPRYTRQGILSSFLSLFHRISDYTSTSRRNSMSKLTFEFSPQKLVQALVYFSKSGIADLTKMKVHKLLFLADKLHLIRHGMPIVGDEYFAMMHGPVLSTTDNFLDAAEETMAESGPDETAGIFNGYAVMTPTSNYPVVVATGADDYDVFSRSERKVLAEIVERYGSMSASALRKLTHKDPAYAIPDRTRSEYGRAPMPYELFFEGESDTTMLQVASAEQEDRELAALVS